MTKTFSNPESLPDWSETFSQVVTVTAAASRIVFVSGQVAVDERQNLVGEGDLAAQAVRAFRNLEAALAAAGATPADVVKLNVYVKQYDPAFAPSIGDALRSVFGRGDLPASTWLGVQSLAKEGFLIEVDALAVVEGS
jgi:enamine deaminase RidA (YjgF/YER057c/UK114 family)